MKFYKLILFILIVFLKTGNLLSNNNIFDVNNIEIEKKSKSNNDEIANQAIKKGFEELLDKILLKEDNKKLEELKFSEIKELVKYYQVSNIITSNNIEKINYNISFDKDKIHNLFYNKKISYSEITNKELFILPILRKNNQIFIYNRNFFYDNWNEIYDNDLIEFIIPIENIEIIQNINSNRDNLLNLQLKIIFEEYQDKNLAIVLIEDNNSKEEKIYLKMKILGKNIVKNITVKRFELNEKNFYEKIIIEIKKEITNTVKSENLIDVRAPSFLNAEFEISEKSNLAELNTRLKKIDLIENIYIQEFNNETVNLKIKYLGKLDKIIRELENQKINLRLVGDQWSIKIIL
ncbi:hypothetical protein OAO00_00930 [Pelagibacteraceae bacterium]|nr:hypothetical protein [Pelagibacteraceae bacterium]